MRHYVYVCMGKLDVYKKHIEALVQEAAIVFSIL